MDDIDHYVKLLGAQRGGEFPVFKGARYVQYGNGFGDVLRGIWRTVFPVMARGAATFMQNLASNKEEGKDWSKAAKEAAIPALTETGDELGGLIGMPGAGRYARRMMGLGKRRKRRAKSIVYKRKNPKSKKSKLTFTAIPKYNF